MRAPASATASLRVLPFGSVAIKNRQEALGGAHPCARALKPSRRPSWGCLGPRSAIHVLARVTDRVEHRPCATRDSFEPRPDGLLVRSQLAPYASPPGWSIWPPRAS